ncbi:MAG: ankyrin repeat domain-containing protein, partial [Fretibacterium sp.]|nr:ankyrin repeat domain-containing protein [Fretibacterium sp.]
AGADVDATDKAGNTALMCAAMNDAGADTLKVLLDAGADVNRRNNDGGTALMFAALKCGSAEPVKLLLARGADVGARTEAGWTPLRLAREYNPTPEILEALAGSGPNQDVLEDWPERVEAFLASLNVTPSSREVYRKKLRYFFAWLDEKGIPCPEREHLLTWRDGLAASERKPATVLNYLTIVRKFFRWAHREGLCADVADGLDIPRVQHVSRDDTLTRGQVQDMLDGIDRRDVEGLRTYALLSLIVACGLNYSEASEAKVGDIEATDGGAFLTVRGGEGRVSVPADVMNALREYWDARGADGADTPVFTSLKARKSQPMSARMIGAAVKKAARKIRAVRFTPTSLRHTAVRLASRSGERLEDVKRFARHRYIGTTFRYGDKSGRPKHTCEGTIASTIF